LPLGGFFLVFEDIFYDRQGEKIAVLEFFDQTNSLYIAIIVIGNVSSPLAGFWEQAFTDVIMNCFFGYAGSLNQLADFQEMTPREGRRAQDQKYSTFFRVPPKALLPNRKKLSRRIW
jgi:hypothetical protein